MIPWLHGLIFEAYNADTSYTTTLHVGASELLRQVNGFFFGKLKRSPH